MPDESNPSTAVDRSRPKDAPSGNDAECDFVDRYGGIYEHSPWVAERTFRRGAVPDPGRHPDTARWHEALAAAFAETVAAASDAEKLALVREHPDLVGRAALADELTEASRREQSGAGLDRCSPEELERFRDLNARYHARFGFPFVLAVGGRDRAGILEAFEARVGNAPEEELARALAEIDRIARLRLQAMASDDEV